MTKSYQEAQSLSSVKTQAPTKKQADSYWKYFPFGNMKSAMLHPLSVPPDTTLPTSSSPEPVSPEGKMFPSETLFAVVLMSMEDPSMTSLIEGGSLKKPLADAHRIISECLNLYGLLSLKGSTPGEPLEGQAPSGTGEGTYPPTLLPSESINWLVMDKNIAKAKAMLQDDLNAQMYAAGKGSITVYCGTCKEEHGKHLIGCPYSGQSISPTSSGSPN